MVTEFRFRFHSQTALTEFRRLCTPYLTGQLTKSKFQISPMYPALTVSSHYFPYNPLFCLLKAFSSQENTRYQFGSDNNDSERMVKCVVMIGLKGFAFVLHGNAQSA